MIQTFDQFLIATRRTHTPEAYAALFAPILRELQERERDILAYLSQIAEVPAGKEAGSWTDAISARARWKRG